MEEAEIFEYSQSEFGFEDLSVELPDLEKTQIWESLNVMVSLFFIYIKQHEFLQSITFSYRW